MHFGTFAHVQRHLDGLGLFHMDLTLGRMQAFLRRAGSPPAAGVQVVGTNGKGSTAAFLAAIAQAHGRRAGLFTSPHFLTVRERVRLCGAMLPEARWAELASRVAGLAGDLTYFEFVTALAALAFREADVAVWEAGLGGRMDATTALEREVVLFTPMGPDHLDRLGPTLADVARDKAGALRPGQSAVTGPQPPEALAVLEAAAAEQGVRLWRAEELATIPPEGELGLAGPHQRHNAMLALAGWRLLARRHGWASDPAQEARGLAAAWLPGRFHRCPAQDGGPPLLLDAAHNPPGLLALQQAVRLLPTAPAGIIFTCLADKDLDAMAPLVARLAEGPVIVPGLVAGPRARDPAQVAARFPGRGRVAASVAAALEQARSLGGPVVVCGSMLLLAEVFALRPHCLERSVS